MTLNICQKSAQRVKFKVCELKNSHYWGGWENPKKESRLQQETLNDLTEEGRGKGAELSNFGNDWSL